MEDLKKELASLRLDDEPPRSRRWAWIVALPVLMVAAGAIVWWGYGVFAATEVETTTPRVERSGDAPSGTPLLTASGYVVARRKAVVSAKIQGRLADLRVDEGARVREGEIIARLESQDYDAQVRRAQAQVQQAEAQIASGRAVSHHPRPSRPLPGPGGPGGLRAPLPVPAFGRHAAASRTGASAGPQSAGAADG